MTIDNVQWAIMVLPPAIYYKIIREADTIIVNCQLSICDVFLNEQREAEIPLPFVYCFNQS